MRSILQLAWARFKIISTITGDVQGSVTATLFYFTILLPFALASRFFSDPLAMKRNKPAWTDREPIDNSLEGARHQG